MRGASMCAGAVLGLVLLFITSVFELVPYNAMGAIVLSSVIGLFELSEAIFLFKANFRALPFSPLYVLG